MEQQKPTIDTWAIVDLFGHQQIAGKVCEYPIGGESMLRIDVPEAPGRSAFTRFYGVKAIYCLTPVSEDIARVAADRLREMPITIYGLALPARDDRLVTAPADPYDWEDDGEDDEEDSEG